MKPKYIPFILFCLLVISYEMASAQQSRASGPIIGVFPPQIHQQITPESSISRTLFVFNSGDEPLEFTAGFAPYTPVLVNYDEHCPAAGGCSCFIGRVTFGDIDTVTGCTDYQDNIMLTTMLVKGFSYPITVANGDIPDMADQCALWIDWDLSRSLEEAEMLVLEPNPDHSLFSGMVTVPENARNGATRLRIRMTRGEELSPCDTSVTGEVEDYSVEVKTWVNASPLAGQVLPGDTTDVTFFFNTAGMVISNHYITCQISSNDPETPLLDVLTMVHVMDLTIFITPEKDSLCEGDSTRLGLMVFGGTENYIYTWSSDPPGFHSSLKEPVVYPAINTWYYVNIADGGYSRTDSVFIKASPLPGKPAIISGPLSVDNHGSAISYFSASPASNADGYLWEVLPQYAGSASGSGLNGTVTWIAGFTGEAQIFVSAENECGPGAPSDNLTVSVYNSSSVKEIGPSANFSVFPNPAHDRLFIRFSSQSQPGEAVITLNDITGRVVISSTLTLRYGENSMQIPIRLLPSGLYWLNIFSGNGKDFINDIPVKVLIY
jgi:hypothetical protein